MTPRARFGLVWLVLIAVLVGVALLSGDLDAERRHAQRVAAIQSAVATSGVDATKGNSHE